MSPKTWRILDHWPLLLLWGFVAAGLFVYCWSDPRLDDLAGWIPAVVFLQLLGLPLAAHPALAPPERLPRGWTILFAISLLALIEAAVLAVALHELGLSLSFETSDKLLLVVLPLLWMAPLWMLMPIRPPSDPPRAVAL